MPKICKWGNSLGLRLPKEIAAAAGIVSGAAVRVRLMDDGSLTIMPLVDQVAVAKSDAAKPIKSVLKW